MTYLFSSGRTRLAYRRESERRSVDSAHLETRPVEAQLHRSSASRNLRSTRSRHSGLMRMDVGCG